VTDYKELGKKLREHHKAIENEVLCLKEQAPEGMDTFAEVAKAISDLSSTIDEVNIALNDKVPTTRTVNNKALSSDITLSAADIGADVSGTAANQITSHNISTASHNDIRTLITGISDRLNALADSDDTTLDQLSEIVAYIKANKTLIESVTTSKVNVADIINDLTTNVSDKPLSAAQGVALKALIDTLQTSVNSKAEASALENYLPKNGQAKSMATDTISTSILEKAIELGTGMYYYMLSGQNYAGEDLPSGNEWYYSSVIITKRNQTSIEVILLHEVKGWVAINSYSGVTWSGWNVLVSQDDLVAALANYQNKNDRRVLDTSAITTPTDIRVIISNYPSGTYTFASFENDNIIMPFEDAVGVMIEWERVFNPTYSAIYGILTVKSMTHCNHSYSCVVYNTNMYTEWVDNNPLHYLSLSGGGIVEAQTPHPFGIKNSLTDESCYVNFNSKTGLLGYLGFYWDKPVYIDGATSALRYLLHEGNVGEYALVKNGGVIGDGKDHYPLVVKGNNGSRKAWIGFRDDTDLGFLGMTGVNNPVFTKNDLVTSYSLHHDGNSAKVVQATSAPTDTTAVWVDTANKVIKIYKDGAWTALA